MQKVKINRNSVVSGDGPESHQAMDNSRKMDFEEDATPPTAEKPITTKKSSRKKSSRPPVPPELAGVNEKGGDAKSAPTKSAAAAKINLTYGPNVLTNQEQLKQWPDNTVSTTKYNIVTWLPKSLLYQFFRMANVYFAVITVLQCMPFSPKQPASMIATFVGVLIFTCLKEGYEDYQRYKQDKEVNEKTALVYDPATRKLKPKLWKDIRVGELVQTLKDEPFPADLLYLKSSSDSGIAFVDTMNLDGETNLKEKACHATTKAMSDEQLLMLSGSLMCDGPNEYLDFWEAVMTIGPGQNVVLDFKQLLLRGTTLRNTKHIFGLVVYAGHNTKAMKNNKTTPPKMSNVLRLMNKILYTVFILQAVICFTFAIASVSWQSEYIEKHYYLGQTSSINFGTFIIQFLTFLVAYSTLIPISLYVALEVLKMAQGTLINRDKEMYFTEIDKTANVRTSDLVEELGQVEFIFSDKTGTLTRNEMIFKKMSVNDEIYGEECDDPTAPYSVCGDSKPFRILCDNDANPHKKPIHDFLTLLSVCHTVVPDIDPKTKAIKYQASSPDELALVEGAARMGYEFFERTSNTLTVRLFGENLLTWEVMCEFPFDSTRKRMTLIVKPAGANFYIMMTKGADSIMFPRLRTSKAFLDSVQIHLDKFARDGLRTLCMGQKVLSAKVYEQFYVQYENLKTSNAPDKDARLNDLYDSLERELDLIGCSAIEDRLQEGVPETIQKLMEGDIRLWVLTGDKQETAIEIAKSCKLLDDSMNIIILSSKTRQEFLTLLDRKWNEFQYGKMGDPIPSLQELTKNAIQKIGIVIDGPTLLYALESGDQVAEKFFKLGVLAASVVCCRVSPKQKADVVALAKKYGPWITLSIGDGANDVAMIMEAHIGVGIFGKEGSQAARSADFAFGQFQYLQKLLLVHGRLAYKRVSWFICYYFYKNVAIVATEINFAFFNGFSGQIFFPDWLPMLYNSLWTSWPCMFTYALERDLPPAIALKFPKLYRAGQIAYYFNLKTFWKWMFFAAWHGAVCFWLPVFGLNGVNNSSGMVQGHWWVSTLAFSLMMIIVTTKLYLETIYWNKVNLVIGAISIIFYFICLFILSADGMAKVFQPQINSMIFSILGSGRAWLVLVFMPIFALCPDMMTLLYQKMFNPNPSDKLMRLIKEKGEEEVLKDEDIAPKGIGQLNITNLNASQDTELQLMNRSSIPEKFT